VCFPPHHSFPIKGFLWLVAILPSSFLVENIKEVGTFPLFSFSPSAPRRRSFFFFNP